MKTHKRPVRALWGWLSLGLVCPGTVLLVAGCTEHSAPTTPTSLTTTVQSVHVAHDGATGPPVSHVMKSDNKGYIDGWVDGDTVHLYYTKSFFCAEPPESGATGGCELGADAETPPRPGPIPTIYAIAAVGGIHPDLSTLACPPLSVCLDHPAMIDASRVGGLPDGPAVPHSHILTERRGGWFHTVNIRVRDLTVWNAIAQAKSLTKVRELQADPEVGGKGLISQDTPTNIFFFIASWRR